ncbi:MAG: MarR family winged helix-turn-helix transcriptional regulator [Filifactoraceae bacterium]
MDYNNEIKNARVDFKRVEPSFFLIGLLSIFENKYQAKADKYFQDITWKQFFTIICIRLFKNNPSLMELAQIMETSHQNTKQLINKLHKIGYVEIIVDEEDKRKQRVIITDKCNDFCKIYEDESFRIMETLFQGIEKENVLTTIETILQMERNLEKI